MTDSDGPRIDLSALDVGEGVMDRVVAAALARVRATPQRQAETIVQLAERALRPALLAASILLVTAAFTVAVVGFGDDARAQPLATVASWADRSHVPSNAELLLAFRGYR
jgi:hypothetical protein